jgi:tripartite-type tricarboxylate transporter receptor subunit TctC
LRRKTVVFGRRGDLAGHVEATCTVKVADVRERRRVSRQKVARFSVPGERRSRYCPTNGFLIVRITMKVSKRQALGLALLALPVLLASPASAQTSTQTWPQRPVRFIIPFGPGAGADIGARLIQEKLSARWGKPVVIDNRPGGDSFIAIQAVLSANDDHTFLWGPSGNFIVHPYLYQKLPYNPDDILPIASFSSTVLSVGVPTSLGVGDLADFVKRAHAENGKWNSAAVPGITELAFDYFAKEAGLTFAKVPYRDIVQAVNDLAEGRLQVYSSSYAIQRPQQQAGRVKVLAQMGGKRAPSLPDIPTAREAGFPAMEMEGLVGLFGSPGAPAELREKIGADIVAVADDKEIDAKLNATAQTPTRGGAKEFSEIMARQRAHIATIAKALDLKPTR